jgi:tRNA threonylcarbamoyladenosine biosynthesis protein TsaB
VKVLAIECSSAVGSVALAVGDRIVVREIGTPREQTERLLQLADELMTSERLAVASLDAVTFGRGPGSFTGLRMAAAIAQGFALGSGVPLLPVSSLACLAQRALRERAVTHALTCVDARMGEVYWGEFEVGADGLVAPTAEERVSAPAGVKATGERWTAVGDGFRAYPELAALAASANERWLDLVPSAVDLLPLALADLRAGRTVAAEAALPVYLRDRTAWRQSQGS